MLGLMDELRQNISRIIFVARQELIGLLWRSPWNLVFLVGVGVPRGDY